MNEQLMNGLVDGLLDMINGGRLGKEEIPDDFRWLEGKLKRLLAERAEVVSSEQNYLAHGGVACLACNEEALEGGSVQIDGAEALQAIHCTECQGSWVDVYQIVRVNDVEFGSVVPENIEEAVRDVPLIGTRVLMGEAARGLDSLLSRR